MNFKNFNIIMVIRICLEFTDEAPRHFPYPKGYNGLFIASFNISQIQLAVTKLKNSCLGQQPKE